MSKHIYPLTCLLSFIIIFSSILLPIIKVKTAYPKATLHGFPISFLSDYYTNIFRIRLGQQSIFTYIDAYTDEAIPDTIFEPHYNLVGFFSKPFHLSAFEAYEIFRVLSIALFLFTVYILIWFVLKNLVEQVVACIFFTFATSFWKPIPGGGLFDIVSPTKFPVVYSPYFSVFERFNSLKAHHYLADAFLIILFVLFSYKGYSKRMLFSLGVAMFSLSFLHPYLSVYFILFMMVFIVTDFCIHRKISQSLIKKFCVICSVSLPITAYHAYVLKYYFRADIDIGGTLVWTPNLMAPSTYFMAIGLVLVFSIPTLFMHNTWIDTRKRIIAIWGFIPILLFFSNALKIPTSNFRIFQTYQIVPLSILAAVFIIWTIRKIRIPMIVGCVIVCTAFIGYSIPSYVKSYSDAVNINQNYFYNQNIHMLSLPVYTFLKDHSKKWSVVLAGENLSMILPTYSDNKVVIGNAGTTSDYEGKKNVCQPILWGSYPISQLRSTLKKYNIKYIVYGIENPSFIDTEYVSLPFLKEVYSQPSNGVSIVEVL